LLERGRVTEERPFHIISLLREKQRTGVPPPALENVYKGLTELGIKDQEGMWAVLRGIDYLMAGQMDEAAAELGLDAKELEKTLQKRSFKAGTDSFESARSKDELRAAQHGLVRSLYSWVFDWLVTNINAALDAPQTTGPYISLVDIFGFESFKSNALAQFLINWANEQLQRQLSKDVLEAQAEAFAAEGIDFGAPAVQPSCLDLLSNKPGKPGQTGIAFLLDDQSRRQSVGLGGSDAMFANNIGTECYSLYGLVTKRANAHPHEFTVVHYGHDVTYDTRGFLEANSERVDDNLRKLLSQSGASYIRDLVDPSLQQKATPGRSAFTSIVSSFRRSLEKLNTLLISTNVHYIHCIKSNHQAAPWLLERDSVELQVEATGITQIARFARECGPYLVKRDDMSPYLLVLDNYDDLTDATQQLAAIVGDPDGKAVQLGQTHVFFRAAALSKIESKLSAKIKIVVALQSCARRSLSRARYIAVRDEARRVAEEKRREAERKRAEAEAAKRRAEEQRRRAEEERKRSEEEKKRAELRAAKEAAAAAHAVQRARRTSNQDPSLSPQRTTRRLSRRTSTDSFTTQMSPSSGRRTPLSSLNNSTMITTPGTDTPPRTPKTQRGPSPGRLSIAAMRRARSQALPLKEYTASCMRTPDSSELRSAPFYNKTVMHDLIQDLVRSATDYESAFTAGSLLARTVSWFHDADLRYVPELLTPLLLQSVRNDIGPAPELAHLWLLAVLSHSFRLDAGHRPARHLGTVEKELLDLVIKHVYAVSKQILDAVLPGKDGAAPATQADITQLLNGVWASIEKLPVSIREATAQAVLGRVLQIVIQNILLKEITEENAVALRVNLQPMFSESHRRRSELTVDWRDNVNLPTSALETVVSAMLASLSGDSEVRSHPTNPARRLFKHPLLTLVTARPWL
jgi:hypothetical protein